LMLKGTKIQTKPENFKIILWFVAVFISDSNTDD
jgi:hypothetical protein